MFLKCFGCMNELPEHTEICPVCGLNKTTFENPKECLEAGHILGGRFVIGKAIGIGSFGVSYIAWDCVDENPVTIKEFLPSDLACHHAGSPSLRFFSEDDRVAFNKGLRTYRSLTLRLSKLSHLECVHNIISFINENDTGYAVMEYLTGQTLKQFLAQYRTLSYDDVVDIMAPVIRTVSSLHKEDIFHLSISPDNIFLCDDGRVTLLNFASARFEMFSDTTRRSIFLHHGFAPIEMYSDEISADQTSDVYSLCAVIYKMITGVVPAEPFARRNGSQVLTPHELGFHMPTAAQNAVMEGLSLYPENRIPTADMLLDVFDADYRNKKTFRPPSWLSPKIIIAVASSLAVIIIGIIIAVVLSDNNDTPEIVTDAVSVSDISHEFSSDFTLSPITDTAVDDIFPLTTKDGHIVLCDTFVFESNGLFGLIKTDGTVTEKATHSSLYFDEKTNTVVFDGKAPVPDEPVTTVDEDDPDDDEIKVVSPVLSDSYKWNAEEARVFRDSDEEAVPLIVSDGSVIVSDDLGKFGLVTKGNLMIEPEYDEALPLSCGISAFRKGDDWSYLNIYGHDIFDKTFKSSFYKNGKPFSFSDGCVPIYNEASKLWGYADYNGEMFIDPSFVCALPVINGNSFVASDDGWKIFSVSDKNNGEIISSVCGNNITYSLSPASGLLEITGSGEMWDFNATNSPWYSYRNIVRTIRITGQISYIGSYAFCGFDSLTSVTFPGTLSSIGSFAFNSCTALRSVTLPSSLTLICDEAFSDCTALSNVLFPDYLNNIGISAFKNCTDLLKVSLGNGLFSVSDYAFFGCTSLSELSIASKNAEICNFSFAKCSSLKTVTLPTKAVGIGLGAFFDCASLSEITLPLGIPVVNDFTFKNCTSLTNVTFCDGILSVGKEAFANCSSLTRVTVPQSVHTVKEGSFKNCTSLLSASVPSATTIESFAFAGCTSISSFEIPETLKNLGSNAFDGWSSRQTIYGKNMLLKQTIARPSGWDPSWKANCNANITSK